MSAIAFQSVSKVYQTSKGPFQALNNVSLDIEEGEFFGLLGPNGAGKTTMISILAGLARASGGSVKVLGSDVRENILGIAEVRDVFRSPKFGAIAGCMVIEGVVHRNRPIRVLREDVVIFEGELESLRRFKDDASEVRNGMECGIGVKSYNDVKVGDKIEVFEKVQVARSL